MAAARTIAAIPYTPRLARRLTATLFVVQSLASASLIANAAVNPIIGARLGGTDALAGLPGTMLLLGAAVASYPAGQLMQRVGRRNGLALGFGLGALGMLLGALGINTQSLLVFLAGLVLIGCARGATDQSRYAAADAETPARRGRAISTVVFAGTIGAVGGPAMVAPLAGVAERLGFDPYSGSMVGGALLFGMAALLLMALLRPDPLAIARGFAAAAPPPIVRAIPQHAAWQVLLANPGVRAAVAAMTLGQAVMVMVMTVTSLHMYHNHHGLNEVSLVIAAHTFGMFGVSFITGALAARIGQRATIVIGCALLALGCLAAPLSPQLVPLALTLFLVGVGWNLCYIAGSSLLTETVAAEERGAAQGAAEVAVNLASAVGSLGSGFVMAALGFGALCIGGALMCIVPALLAVRGVRGALALPRSGQ